MPWPAGVMTVPDSRKRPLSGAGSHSQDGKRPLAEAHRKASQSQPAGNPGAHLSRQPNAPTPHVSSSSFRRLDRGRWSTDAQRPTVPFPLAKLTATLTMSRHPAVDGGGWPNLALLVDTWGAVSMDHSQGRLRGFDGRGRSVARCAVTVRAQRSSLDSGCSATQRVLASCRGQGDYDSPGTEGCRQACDTVALPHCGFPALDERLSCVSFFLSVRFPCLGETNPAMGQGQRFPGTRPRRAPRWWTWRRWLPCGAFISGQDTPRLASCWYLQLRPSSRARAPDTAANAGAPCFPPIFFVPIF